MTEVITVNGFTHKRTFASSDIRMGDNKSKRHNEIQTLCRQITRVSGEQTTPLFDGSHVSVSLEDGTIVISKRHEDLVIPILREDLHKMLRVK